MPHNLTGNINHYFIFSNYSKAIINQTHIVDINKLQIQLIALFLTKEESLRCSS